MKRTLEDLRRAREEMFGRLPVGKYETSIEAMGIGVLIADCALGIYERLDLISVKLDRLPMKAVCGVCKEAKPSMYTDARYGWRCTDCVP